jgi:hypothetical protein
MMSYQSFPYRVILLGFFCTLTTLVSAEFFQLPVGVKVIGTTSRQINGGKFFLHSPGKQEYQFESSFYEDRRIHVIRGKDSTEAFEVYGEKNFRYWVKGTNDSNLMTYGYLGNCNPMSLFIKGSLPFEFLYQFSDNIESYAESGNLKSVTNGNVCHYSMCSDFSCIEYQVENNLLKHWQVKSNQEKDIFHWQVDYLFSDDLCALIPTEVKNSFLEGLDELGVTRDVVFTQRIDSIIPINHSTEQADEYLQEVTAGLTQVMPGDYYNPMIAKKTITQWLENDKKHLEQHNEHLIQEQRRENLQKALKDLEKEISGELEHKETILYKKGQKPCPDNQPDNET